MSLYRDHCYKTHHIHSLSVWSIQYILSSRLHCISIWFLCHHSTTYVNLSHAARHPFKSYPKVLKLNRNNEKIDIKLYTYYAKNMYHSIFLRSSRTTVCQWIKTNSYHIYYKSHSMSPCLTINIIPIFWLKRWQSQTKEFFLHFQTFSSNVQSWKTIQLFSY